MEAAYQQPTVVLLDVPEEVLTGHIFPHLPYNVLLRLRRVCQPIKDMVDGFIRNNFKDQEREINETNHTFGDYLRLNLPTTKIYINSTGFEIFDDPDLPQFIHFYGDLITHVRLRHFSAYLSQLRFFCALKNLEYLELEFIDASNLQCNYEKTIYGFKIPEGSTPFPETFKNLKTLKLNEIDDGGDKDQVYACLFVDFCKKLEYLKHPVRVEASPYDQFFTCVMDSLRDDNDEDDDPQRPDSFNNLKFYDMDNDKELGLNTMFYCDLVRLCHQHGIKLLNVLAGFHEFVQGSFLATPEVFTTPLISLQNVHGNIFLDELPNLEKLVVFSTGKSCFKETWMDIGREEPEWPKLKILDITIDSAMMDEGYEIPDVRTQNLLNFLFVGKKRVELKELAIRFPKTLCPHEYFDLPVPRVQHITASCGNVTKLELTSWLGTNKQVSMLWEGLPLLEIVSLEKCMMLGDVAFVGRRKEDPTFLKLHKLRKLALMELDEMPKITDLVFNLVFRHLKVEQFCLHSHKPLKSITVAGIESLLSGNFNDHVENFPFDTFSLEGVSGTELAQLKSKFRASDML